jgi:ABC-2 type transport system ATP-binding protein
LATQALELDGLVKRFGDVVALDDLSFTVNAAEIFGFVGSNGAGKTTAMRIVLGVLDADAGQVRWNGERITSESRRHIGYMPEERGLYPRMKVREQLEYLTRLHGLPRARAAAAVEEWTERLGVSSRLEDEVQKLSLGNQQRVQLAAALIHDPQVLVLDEPFSGLDPLAVDVMSNVLREKAAEGIPVVFSSHQLDLVERLCDRVGIVQTGRMVAVGSVEALRSSGPERVLVEAPAAPAGWASGLPGFTVVQEQPGRVVLEVAAGTDEQAALRAALATGPVREFSRARPTLVELYRDVVSSNGEQVR